MQLDWQLLDPADAAHQAALASLYPFNRLATGQGADQKTSQKTIQKTNQKTGLDRLLASPRICGLLGWELQASGLRDRKVPGRPGRRALFFCLARRAGPVCDLIELATAADMRRRGIALCGLARFCLYIAHQQPQAEIFLEVAEDNLAARQLYQKAGFAEQARRPGYYRRGDGRVDGRVDSRVDALLLCWQAGSGLAHIESLAKGC